MTLRSPLVCSALRIMVEVEVALRTIFRKDESHERLSFAHCILILAQSSYVYSSLFTPATPSKPPCKEKRQNRSLTRE